MTLDAASRIALQELGYDPDDPELEQGLVDEQADDLEWLDRVQHQHPLATSVLWRNDAVSWDQRRATIAAMTSPYVTVVKGGERSGKSLGPGKQLTLAQALGGDHPSVRQWLELNDLPRHAIPDGPGRVYALALDSNASRRYHRPDFDLLQREGKNWYNRLGKGEAQLFIRVPGYDRMAEIWFKGVDQGPDAMQGDSIRWWWIDEEPTTEKGRLVYRQLLARAMDQTGRGVITMVPMSGMTWVHDRLIRDGEDKAVIATINALDNPHLPPEAVDYFGSMTEEERAIRQLGEFRSKAGVVYPSFIDGTGDRWGMGHLCDDFEIPSDWLRYRGKDFGLVNPTCVLWGAPGDDDTLYIYREYYKPDGASFKWHADQVAPMEGLIRESEEHPWTRGPNAESIECGWGDPASKVGRRAFNDEGLETLPANNDVKAGIDRVKERLRRRSDGRPRLKIFRSCRNLLRELPAYLWDPMRKDEVPLKKDDHSCDALRYLVQGIHYS